MVTIPQAYAVQWSAETPLTTDLNSADYSPAIVQTSDEKIWVFYHSYKTGGGKADIYYKIYNGTAWTNEMPFFPSSNFHEINPAAIRTRDGKLWVFWSSDKLGPVGRYKLYYRTSSDNGNTWTDETRLTSKEKYLYVDAFTETTNGNWTKTGNSPYLNAVDYPISFINQTAAVTSSLTTRPNGDGTYTSWTGNYIAWNETVPDGDSTYVSAAANNLNESSTLLKDLNSIGTITKVRLTVNASQTAGNEQVRLMLKSQEKWYNGSIFTPLNLTYTSYSSEWLTNPATGLGWTWTEVNDLEAGVRSQQVGSWGGELRITQLFLEVFAEESIGDFTFEDMPSYQGGRVYIELYAKQLALNNDTLDTVEVWLYNQTANRYSLADTITPSNMTWSWTTSVDVSSTLNSTSKVNEARVYLVKKTIDAPQNIEIDSMRLKIDLGSDRRPSVMQTSDGKLWLFWGNDRNGNEDLYYSVYDGASWSDQIRFTNDPSRDYAPSVIQAKDGKLWVFWVSTLTGDLEIFYTTSSNNGVTWSNATNLTVSKTSSEDVPSAIQTRDGKIWVAWETDKGGTDFDIVYKTFDGVSWSNTLDLVVNSGQGNEDVLPCLFQAANKIIWVAWSTSRVDMYDVFYKVSIPDTHDIGIASITSSVTYAHPDFGTQVLVWVSARNYGISQETFTVSAYYNSTRIGTQTVTNLAPNSSVVLTFTWDTLNVPYGYYTLRAEANIVYSEIDTTDNTLTDGTVMLAIPGDVNFDRIVNILDAGELSAHWYNPPVVGRDGYDPRIDINQDGKIDLYDAAIMSAHWHISW